MGSDCSVCRPATQGVAFDDVLVSTPRAEQGGSQPSGAAPKLGDPSRSDAVSTDSLTPSQRQSLSKVSTTFSEDSSGGSQAEQPSKEQPAREQPAVPHLAAQRQSNAWESATMSRFFSRASIISDGGDDSETDTGTPRSDRGTGAGAPAALLGAQSPRRPIRTTSASRKLLTTNWKTARLSMVISPDMLDLSSEESASEGRASPAAGKKPKTPLTGVVGSFKPPPLADLPPSKAQRKMAPFQRLESASSLSDSDGSAFHRSLRDPQAPPLGGTTWMTQTFSRIFGASHRDLNDDSDASSDSDERKVEARDSHGHRYRHSTSEWTSAREVSVFDAKNATERGETIEIARVQTDLASSNSRNTSDGEVPEASGADSSPVSTTKRSLSNLSALSADRGAREAPPMPRNNSSMRRSHRRLSRTASALRNSNAASKTEIFFKHLKYYYRHKRALARLWRGKAAGAAGAAAAAADASETNLSVTAKAIFKDDPLDLNLTKRRGGAWDRDMRQEHRGAHTPTNASAGAAAGGGGTPTFSSAFGIRKLASFRPERKKKGAKPAALDATAQKSVMNVQELLEAAKAARPVLHELIRGAAQRTDGLVFQEHWVAPVKDLERCVSKAREAYAKREPGPPEAWIYDACRGMMVCATIRQMRDAVAALHARAAELGGGVVRVKNRLLRPTFAGFRDVIVNVRLPVRNGPGPAASSFFHICEVQVLHARLLRYDDESDCHATYAYFRTFFSGGGEAARAATALLGALRSADASSLASHVDRFCASGDGDEDAYGSSPEDLEALFCLLHERLEKHGLACRVAERLHEMVASSTPLVAERNPDVAFALKRLADALEATSSADALEKRAEALAIMRRFHEGDEGHPDVALMAEGLAKALFSFGRSAEALEMYAEVLASRRKLLGEEDPETARTLIDLARVHAEEETGRARALDCYREALEILRNGLGPRHLDTCGALLGRARVLMALERYGEAYESFDEARDVQEEALGFSHPSVATTLLGIAEAEMQLYHYEDALDKAERAVAIRREALGPVHEDTASALVSLANVLSIQGYQDKALAAFREALAICRYANGSHHRQTADTLDGMANLLQYELDSFEEALSLHQEALQIRRVCLGEEHPDTASTLINMANILQEGGELGGAEGLYKEALEIYRKALGPSDPLLGITYFNFANLLFDALDKKAEGIAMARDAYRIFLDAGGAEHPYCKAAKDALQEWEEEEKALAL